VLADLYVLTAVTLLGRHEFDAAGAVLVVVPLDERCQPLTGLVLAGERLTRVIRSILHRPEQVFRVWVVVRHPWSGGRPEHAQFLQPAFQCVCRHGVAVVGMEDQRLLPCLAVPLSEATLLTRSAAMAGSSRSSTSQATTLRLKTSITR
jgi:hypothetical protein